MAPVVDGDLGEPVWQEAPPLRDLVQQLPVEGAPASERTEVRFGYDGHSVYFAFRLWDSQPGEVVAWLTRRDRDVSSDAITIDLDSRGDRLSAFHFEVSAAGVQRDAIRSGDQALNFDWNAVWHSAVQRDMAGWTAEIAIPLAVLRFDASGRGGWRLQVRRFIARRNETDALVLIPGGEFGEMLRYAPVLGVADVTAPRGIQLQPFGLARLRARPAPGDPGMPLQADLRWQVGLDARYGLTSGLTLDATVLPDFGQVEADQVVLNLSTFEVRFPEKRPFFLDGAELFTLKTAHGPPVGTAQLFESRRIGASAPRATGPGGNTVVDAPEQVRLLGAVKLTGKVTDRVALAVVDAVTASESAVLRAPDGSTLLEPLAPATNLLAARAQVLPDPRWTLGMMATHVLRFEPPGSLLLDGRCPGRLAPGEDGRCTHDAFTALLDARWESEDGGLISTPAALMSYTPGGPPRVLPDGTELRSGDIGFGGRLVLVKASGTWPWEIVTETFSPKLDLNDVGFLRAQNLHRASAKIGWRTFQAGPFQETQLALAAFVRQSWDNVPIERAGYLIAAATWRNAWKSTFQVGARPVQYDNRETRDGARTERAPDLSLQATLATDPSRPLSGSAYGSTWTAWRGYGLDAGASLSYRPAGRLELSVDATVTRVVGDPRWLETFHPPEGGARYRFGLQDALAPGLTLHGTLTFTPNMTLQVYAQLFFASVRYGQLFEVDGAEARPWLRLAAFEPVAADGAGYGAQDAVLNLNLIFRYEYLPGSVLYLVFTRSHAGGQVALDPAGGRPRIDFSALGRAPAENAFLVKCSYHFDG